MRGPAIESRRGGRRRGHQDGRYCRQYRRGCSLELTWYLVSWPIVVEELERVRFDLFSRRDSRLERRWLSAREGLVLEFSCPELLPIDIVLGRLEYTTILCSSGYTVTYDCDILGN